MLALRSHRTRLAYEAVRIRNPLRFRRGRDRLRLDDLISPLRYDVLIRQQYFDFLAAHATPERSFDDLVEMSTQQPYFAWFRHIVAPHFAIGQSEAHVRRAFAKRVHAATALLRSFEATGYRRRYPLIVLTGRVVAPTATGKHLTRRFYARDSLHRLALLRRAGVTTLEPGMYRLRTVRTLIPVDHTFRLLQILDVGTEEYFEYLSLSYGGDAKLRDRQGLLDAVARRDPARVAEVQQVIAVDEPFILSGP